MNIWERCYQRNSNIVFRQIADQSILVPIRNNIGDLESIYTLNEVASRIWELIDGKRNVGQIRDTIVDEFEITLEEAEKDLEQFLQKLEKIEVIEHT